MRRDAKRYNWGTEWMAVAIFCFSLISAGCDKIAPPSQTTDTTPSSDIEAVKVADPPSPYEPHFHQSFAEATITDPPAEWHRPPDTTMTNKSVGKLYTEVIKKWDEIKLQNPQGKKLVYRAVLDTEMGPIEITLRPDLAPNHVRNFVALAWVGYYDGLVFDRTVHEDVDGIPENKLELIEAGCPLGTGDAGYGSIGYWLKPEFSSQASHEEGTVGASHGEEADTAACKFYINLSKAKYMDGNFTVFGKVTEGLSVARKILSLPVRTDEAFPEGDRPVKPVVIRKVTIQVEEEKVNAG